MQLRIAEQHITQFGKLARGGTTLVVPANLTDLASIVTMATSIAEKDSPQPRQLEIYVGQNAKPRTSASVSLWCSPRRLMATQAFAVDAMLPALPTIVRELLVANANHGQWIVTAYVVGVGMANSSGA